MISSVYETAAQDASWFAIRHPAVLRLLERELATDDGDAFAAGLELACRVLGGRTPVGDLRLDHNTLNSGMVAVRSGRCDRAMIRSIRDQIAALNVVLTQREHDAVATVLAAIIWAVLDASARDLDALDDAMVA
ncbi:MAG TPA: hypothetical protein VFP84_19305 [Kofleriaceae bacterium]|nr:hypothetical protein [Kofleriaceae bacterium]